MHPMQALSHYYSCKEYNTYPTRGRVKLLLKDGRIRTLPRVLHIPKLARSIISVSKLDDAGVDIVFGENTCKMV
jgi:hypothetical protein